jgi:hypothetical protein
LPGRRAEIVAAVAAHVGHAASAEPSYAEIPAVLERPAEPDEGLGERSAAARGGVRRAQRGPREWGAIVLLLLGGMLGGIGWVVGLVLLWTSRAWTNRDKWIGSLLVPGGLAFPVYVLVGVGGATQSCWGYEGGAEQCTGGSSDDVSVVGVVVVAILFIAPIVTALYLASRAGRSGERLSP